ncbi:MAG: hypothetical protein ACLUNO_11685 [Oscillospiraceae bacterium]
MPRWAMPVASSSALPSANSLPAETPNVLPIGIAESARSRNMSAPRSRACCVMVSSSAGPETSGTPG